VRKQGIVLKSTGSFYDVKLEDGKRVKCTLKGNFRIKGIKMTNPVTVGDHVIVDVPEKDEIVSISEVLQRNNCIIRKATNLSKQSHVIAANIDCAYIVVSLKNPCVPLGFIDRYLVAAESYFIPVTIVFNKIDIYDEEARALLDQYKKIYSNIGYQHLEVSALGSIKIDDLKNLLKDKVNLFSGQSGVGKTTLINKIQPGLNLKTADVSLSNDKGKHITTFAEMHELYEGGFIIDTPGLREFGLINFSKEEISLFFPEMKALLEHCRFYNCIHIHEPGCAVKEALHKGKIALSRYNNYLQMIESQSY